MSEGRYQSRANAQQLLDDIDWLHDRLDNMADTILAYRLTLGEELQDSERTERIITACEVMLEEDDYQVVNRRFELFEDEKHTNEFVGDDIDPTTGQIIYDEGGDSADTSDLFMDLGLIEDEYDERVIDDGA